MSDEIIITPKAQESRITALEAIGIMIAATLCVVVLIDSTYRQQFVIAAIAGLAHIFGKTPKTQQ